MYFHSFIFNNTSTTQLYTLSLHDALPISSGIGRGSQQQGGRCSAGSESPHGGDAPREYHAEAESAQRGGDHSRSEEHTSELQSHVNLVCRLLLEKKKKKIM